MRSQMASASVDSPIFACQPGVSNWEQKIVDALLQRASTISSRSRASVSFSGNRSHSSRISSLTCLYCFMTFLKKPSPRAIAFGQDIRQADVPDGEEGPAGGHAEGAGDVGLAVPGSAQQDDVVRLLDVALVAKRSS